MANENRVGPTVVQNYRTCLVDKYRPPSKGGNTRAWHRHSFEINGDVYSFLALGSKKWVYVNDSVEFNWTWDETEKYRNITANSVVTLDKNGDEVVRGERGAKKWRTSPARMPASKREQRD